MPQTFLYATRGLLHKKQKTPNKTKTNQKIFPYCDWYMLDFILCTSHIKLLTTAAQIISNDVMLVCYRWKYLNWLHIKWGQHYKKRKKEKKEQKEQKHKKASICRISAKSGEQIKTVKPKQRLALSVFFRHELKCKASSGASEY